MKIVRTMLLIGLGLGVSACAAVDVPTRNAPFEQLPSTVLDTPDGYQAQPLAMNYPPAESVAKALHQDLAVVGEPSQSPLITAGQSPVSVANVVVRVPRSLKVSERNSYLPRGDIVWRGDPIGDRHAQVQKIVQDSIIRGVTPLAGPVNVNVDVLVTRFHALTEKARYTTGGVHSITFDLKITQAETGQLIVPVRTVRADLDAFGGQQAILAEARGLTQKVRITNHLAEVIRQELTNKEGYRNAQLGIYQLMNNL
ncbi:hypothetical protein QEZ52_13680 [Aliisedimentitalea scapharcae]|uniref:Lipoprotein n=1 Tax=Aliisedimentitalea scapharcae TaxID=1524259 RepID=A0ABZ2XNK5_9RHOB|nr:hypothetical protein K3727_13590 [Rhodobacteraceae bacterium M382]